LTKVSSATKSLLRVYMCVTLLYFNDLHEAYILVRLVNEAWAYILSRFRPIQKILKSDFVCLQNGRNGTTISMLLNLQSRKKVRFLQVFAGGRGGGGLLQISLGSKKCGNVIYTFLYWIFRTGEKYLLCGNPRFILFFVANLIYFMLK
jgi:hypothetical protein